MSDKPKVKLAWLGGSYFRRREILAKIEERFAGSDRIVCFGDMSAEYLISEIETVSCFNDRKLVLIHDMPILNPSNRTKSVNALKETIESLREGTFVVFNGIDPTKFKTLHSYVKSAGKVYEFEDTLDPNAAPSWVVKQFEALGKKISPETAKYLVENCGWDEALKAVGCDLLEMTIRELDLYLGKTKEVTEDHIATCSCQSENFVVWDLTNALDAKDFDECIKIVAKASILQDSARDAVSQLFSMLMWRFRMLFFLKECIAKTSDREEVIKTAMSMRKLSQSGNGEAMKMTVDLLKSGENEGQPSPAWNFNAVGMALNGFYNKKAAIECYTRRELFRIIQCIEDAIWALRLHNSDAMATVISDVFFMAVCNKIDDSSLRKLRTAFVEV